MPEISRLLAAYAEALAATLGLGDEFVPALSVNLRAKAKALPQQDARISLAILCTAAALTGTGNADVIRPARPRRRH
jgi:hypothetical protein